MDTSVLLRCYLTFVLPILEYCSSVCGSAAESHLQLVERQVYSVARLCSDQSFLLLCHRRRVADLSIGHKVNSNYNHCLFCELSSASTRVRHTELRPQHIHWSLKYQCADRCSLYHITGGLLAQIIFSFILYIHICCYFCYCHLSVIPYINNESEIH